MAELALHKLQCQQMWVKHEDIYIIQLPARKEFQGENLVLKEVKEGFTRALFFQLALLGEGG